MCLWAREDRRKHRKIRWARHVLYVPSMGSLTRFQLAFAVMTLGLVGCARSYPVPTQAMARAAVEVHLAEQAGATHTREGAQLHAQAAEALDASRRAVARGRNQESEALANQCTTYAQQARYQVQRRTLVATSSAPAVTLAKVP